MRCKIQFLSHVVCLASGLYYGATTAHLALQATSTAKGAYEATSVLAQTRSNPHVLPVATHFT